MNLLKKIFNSKIKIVTLQLGNLFLVPLFAMGFIQTLSNDSSDFYRETIFYMIISITLLISGLTSAKILKEVIDLFKNFSWMNLFFILGMILVLFATYWSVIFSSILIIGFA